MSIRIRIAQAKLLAALMLCFACAAEAHFGIILPSDNIITRGEQRELVLQLKLLHPYENAAYDMDQPRALIVWHEGQEQDIADSLVNVPQGAGNIWNTTYVVSKPGDYIIYMEPSPSFEPTTDLYVVYYAKVVINAMGRSGQWKTPVGMKAEIVPMSRPYGVWAGSVFQGQVLIDNSPAPNIEVEVEHLNDPSTGHVLKGEKDESALSNQVVLTDARGIFTASMPAPGWWGFKALSAPKYSVAYKGKNRPVQVGAVIWVYAEEIK